MRAPIINEHDHVTGLLYFPNFEKLFEGQNLTFNKSINKKRVLLVGGGGYIGSLLVRILLKSNYYVIVYDLFKFGSKSLNEVKKIKI